MSSRSARRCSSPAHGRVARTPLRRAWAAAGIVVALSTAPARAAEDPQAEPVSHPEEEPSPAGGLRLQLRLEGASEIDHGDASVSWLRGSGRAVLERRLSERWAATLGATFEYAAPDIDGDDGFLVIGTASRPTFDDLIETTFRAGVRRELGKGWAVGGLGYFTAKLERHASLGDSLQGGGIFAVEYAPSERFDAIAGVKVGSRLGRSGALAQPYLRLRWQISDALRFRLDNTKLRLELRAADRLDVFAFAAARFDRYRLDERAGLPANANAGTLSVGEAVSGVGLRWRASERVRWTARLGAQFWQRLIVRDEHADRIDRSETHAPALFARLELERRF